MLWHLVTHDWSHVVCHDLCHNWQDIIVSTHCQIKITYLSSIETFHSYLLNGKSHISAAKTKPIFIMLISRYYCISDSSKYSFVFFVEFILYILKIHRICRVNITMKIILIYLWNFDYINLLNVSFQNQMGNKKRQFFSRVKSLKL